MRRQQIFKDGFTVCDKRRDQNLAGALGPWRTKKTRTPPGRSPSNRVTNTYPPRVEILWSDNKVGFAVGQFSALRIRDPYSTRECESGVHPGDSTWGFVPCQGGGLWNASGVQN